MIVTLFSFLLFQILTSTEIIVFLSWYLYNLEETMSADSVLMRISLCLTKLFDKDHLFQNATIIEIQ